MSADDYRHCETLVREADKDRFLSALFAPAAQRDALFALYAFNVEITRIPQMAREPFAAAIRLQWWRDALNGERPGEATAHPVAAALIDALATTQLSPASLLDYLELQRAIVFGETETNSDAAIFLTAARLLGANEAPVSTAANNAGMAYALAIAGQLPVVARDNYAAFRAQADKLPKAAAPAFLPAALVPLLLAQPDAPQWRRQIALAWAFWFGYPRVRR